MMRIILAASLLLTHLTSSERINMLLIILVTLAVPLVVGYAYGRNQPLPPAHLL
jgi:hypothetical protein